VITDWPADAWLGDRYLEIAVACPSGGGLTVLDPRRRVTSAPTAALAYGVAPASIGATEIDSTEVQRRIGSACPAGQAISSVAADGSPTCAPLGNADWYSTAENVSTIKRVGVGTNGYNGSKFLVMHNSSISAPHAELYELDDDYARLTLSSIGVAGDYHYDFWTLAARTESATSGGPAADRLNLYNSRSGDLFTLLGNGNLGVGITSPQNRLDVNGGLRVRAAADATATSNRKLLVEPDGDVVADSATKYLVVPHTLFRPHATGFTYTAVWDFELVSGSSAYLIAPVQLPDRARIVSATAWLLDNAVDTDLEVNLYADFLNGGGPSPIAHFLTSGNSASRRSFASGAISHTVDNSTYAYSVWVTPFVAGSGDPGTLTTWKGPTTKVASVVIGYKD